MDFNPDDWQEFSEQFSALFPVKKESVKIIVATVKGRVVAQGSMWIEQ